MFKELLIREMLYISPKYFGESHKENITTLISLRYLNKVNIFIFFIKKYISKHIKIIEYLNILLKIIRGEGLCVGIKSINKIGTAFLLNGTGSEQVAVSFSLIVFSPFVGEVIIGKVDFADNSGMLINIGFFKNIFIEANQLPQPSNLLLYY